MKFGQLIDEKHFFLKNLAQNAMKILFPDPFLKKLKLSVSLDQYSKGSYSLFLCYAICQVEDYQNILKLSCKPLAFTLYKAFVKKEKVWN